MSKFLCTVAASSTGAFQTGYLSVAYGTGFLLIAESGAGLIYRTPCTFTNLYANINTNSNTVVASLRFRKNGADGNLTLSIGAGLTGEFQDTLNTDSIVAGDVVDLFEDAGDVALSHSEMQIVGDFQGKVQKFESQVLLTSTDTLKFAPLVEGAIVASPESRVQLLIYTDFTFSNGAATTVFANTRLNTTTIGLRRNSANGNLAISIGAGATGIFEDTVNTDAAVNGDLVNWYISSGSTTGTIQARITAEVANAQTKHQALCSAGSSAITLAAGGTFFSPVNWVKTSSGAAIPAQLNHTASNLQCTLTANTTSSPSTLVFRKNGVTGNMSVSIGAGLTGIFSDLTNTDSVQSTDQLNYMWTVGTGTSLVFAMIGYLVANTLVAAVPPPFVQDCDAVVFRYQNTVVN
jgi:hypothetical protein